jgi:alkylation response protein AidB-like acyl-CoA dehydrogenase
VRHDDDWYPGHMKRSRDWQRVLYEHGWAGLTWPAEHGGRGATAMQQTIFSEEQARHDVSAGALVVMRILGAEGTLDADDAPLQGHRQDSLLDQNWVRIGGGTDEVQKNTIGERVLGLPREPGNDREIPWRDLARS